MCSSIMQYFRLNFITNKRGYLRGDIRLSKYRVFLDARPETKASFLASDGRKNNLVALDTRRIPNVRFSAAPKGPGVDNFEKIDVECCFCGFSRREDHTTGPMQISGKNKDTLVFFSSLEPSYVSLFSSLLLLLLLLESNSRRVPGGTREMLLLYVGRIPSFHEIGEARVENVVPGRSKDR